MLRSVVEALPINVSNDAYRTKDERVEKQIALCSIVHALLINDVSKHVHWRNKEYTHNRHKERLVYWPLEAKCVAKGVAKGCRTST